MDIGEVGVAHRGAVPTMPEQRADRGQVLARHGGVARRRVPACDEVDGRAPALLVVIGAAAARSAQPVQADRPGSATRVRLMAVESGRNVPRVADPGRPDIEGTGADETMIAVRSATPVTAAAAVASGRSRLPRHVAGGAGAVVTGGAKPCAARGAKHFVACRAHDEPRRVVRCVALT